MKIVWTALAKAQLKEVFQYYKEVAGGRVAKSVRIKILEKTNNLLHHPEIGQVESNPLVASLRYRYLISGNYKVIYRIENSKKIALIVAIFDTRQHPDALKV